MTDTAYFPRRSQMLKSVSPPNCPSPSGGASAALGGTAHGASADVPPPRGAAPESDGPGSVSAPESVLPGSQGREFIRPVVAGRKLDVETEFETFAEPPCGDGLDRLRESPMFTETLYRLRRNFTLYLFLPVQAGRHRMLRMSFDEPTSWKYQRAVLEPDPEAPRGLQGRATAAERKADPTTKDVWRYEPGYAARRRHQIWSAIGIRPTQIRFQIPSAEHCASYHFEAKAPLGLRIVSGSLVAGRPNDPWRHVSADYQDDHSPIVGLQATQIPYGSLCRAQVRLRVPTRGWLTTLWVSCSLLVWMRGIGLVVISLPIIMAGILAYSSQTPGQPPPPRWQQWVADGATGLAFCIAAFVTFVWIRSKRAERRVDAAQRRSLSGKQENRSATGRSQTSAGPAGQEGGEGADLPLGHDADEP